MDGTGSPLATRQCESCHQGGTYQTQANAVLVDAAGEMQTAYRPGEAYRLVFTATTAVDPTALGFQAVVLNNDDEQAGSYGSLEENLRLRSRNGVEYVDHTGRISRDTISVAWIAPDEGTGTVDVYAVINAVNANGGTSGDTPDEVRLTLAEVEAPPPPPTYTVRTLPELRNFDATSGVPTLLGERVEVEGLVFGTDTEPDVSNFNLLAADNSAGVSVLNYSDTLNYNAQHGDRLRVRGTVQQIVGLTYIEALEIEILATGEALPEPVALQSNDLSEALEGRLVLHPNLRIADSTLWQPDATSTYDFPFLNENNDTVIAQIAVGMPIHEEAAVPGDARGTYEVAGILRQFDLDEPFFSGYYLLPRIADDFTSSVSVNTREISAVDLRYWRGQSSSGGLSLIIESRVPLSEIAVFTLDGRLLHRSQPTSSDQRLEIELSDAPLGRLAVRVRAQDGRVSGGIR